MFVVWIAIRQIAPEDLKVITRTLLEVFPDTTMWLHGYYLAFVSTTQPAVWDAEQIQRRFADRPMREALDQAGLDSPLGLLASFIAGPPALGRFADGQPLNTEDRPIIEFRTPRLGDRLNSQELATTNLDILCALQEPLCPAYVTADRSTRLRLEQALAARATANQALVLKCLGRHIEAADLFKQALALEPSDNLAQYGMEMYLVAHGNQCLERGLLDQAYRVFLQAVEVNPRSVGALASLAALEEAAGNGSEAEKLRRRAMSLDPHNRRLRKRLAGLSGIRVPHRY
jgi:tetratricopeptide (TPR) repeat protein